MKKIVFYLILVLSIFSIIGCKEKDLTPDVPHDDPVVKYKVTIYLEGVDYEEEYVSGTKFDYPNPLPNDYLIIGWYTDEACKNEVVDFNVDKNYTLYTKAIKKGTEYKLWYELAGGRFISDRVDSYKCGEKTKLPTPVKDKNYSFVGWDFKGTIITEVNEKMTGNMTLKAIWSDDAEYKNITYVLNGGYLKETASEKYRVGDETDLPECISNVKEEYFWGWYLDSECTIKIDKIDETYTDDLVIYAKFGEKLPEHTYISFIGDSITTFRGYIPSGFETYYPQGDVKNVEDTWWHMLTTKLGYKLCMNNAYSGSKVASGYMMTSSSERIKYTKNSEHIPDIVVIYMGTNDWAAGTSKADFKAAYKKMIELIYSDINKECKIYLVTLPVNNYSDGYQTLRKNDNAAIRELGNEYSIKVLDLESALPLEIYTSITYSGVHPNKHGMELMANYLYDEMIKDLSIKK